jgi:hypothetical protein
MEYSVWCLVNFTYFSNQFMMVLLISHSKLCNCCLIHTDFSLPAIQENTFLLQGACFQVRTVLTPVVLVSEHIMYANKHLAFFILKFQVK